MKVIKFVNMRLLYPILTGQVKDKLPILTHNPKKSVCLIRIRFQPGQTTLSLTVSTLL